MKEQPGVMALDGTLLSANDPPPVAIDNPLGRSPVLLIGDHAGNAIPGVLGTMGLSEADRTRHIAWDIGIGALGRELAERLDAVFIRQHYSRLVIDCNRAPTSPEAIVAISDGTPVPGNRELDDHDVSVRVACVHAPYQAAIAAAIDARSSAGRPTILVSLHSFTPKMKGFARPWQVGVLYAGGETGFARAMLAKLAADPDLVVGDNEPYRMDQTDFTVPLHAYARRIPYVELEVRQDLLSSEGGVMRWSRILQHAIEAVA